MNEVQVRMTDRILDAIYCYAVRLHPGTDPDAMDSRNIDPDVTGFYQHTSGGRFMIGLRDGTQLVVSVTVRPTREQEARARASDVPIGVILAEDGR